MFPASAPILDWLQSAHAHPVIAVVITLCAAAVGVGAAKLLRIPSAPLIGAMAGTASLQLLGVDPISPPAAIRVLAFAVIGWSIGASVTTDAVHALVRAIWPMLIGLLGLFTLAGAVFLVLWLVADWDLVTSIIASAPGGISHMAALSIDLSANGLFVTAFHLARTITVLTVTPWILARIDSDPA